MKVVDAVFRLEQFIAWLILTTLARMLSKRDGESALNFEAQAMACHMLFMSGMRGLPRELQRRVMRLLVIQLGMLAVLWSMPL